MFVIYINNIKHSAWKDFYIAESKISALRSNKGCVSISIKNEDTKNMLDGEIF
jgi:hypothetical protein